MSCFSPSLYKVNDSIFSGPFATQSIARKSGLSIIVARSPIFDSQYDRLQWDQMSRTVYRISIVLHAFWLLAANPAGAADPASDDRDDFDRWIPSLSLVVGFTTQEVRGSVESVELIAAFGQIFPVELRPFNDNQKHFTTLDVGGSMELQTPQLLPYKWSPRIFIGGEVLNVSAQSRPIAREGNPSSITDPGAGTFPEDAILGQGSATQADMRNVMYGARIGISVPVQIGDWRVSIKPAARYLNQKYTFNGKLIHASRGGLLGDQPPTTIVEMFGDGSMDVHSVGPGLEIEIDAVRIGSVAASVYVSGGGYKVLSDRKTKFFANARDSLDNRDHTATWKAEIEPWIYRASAGFRVKWMGFGSGWLGQGD